MTTRPERPPLPAALLRGLCAAALLWCVPLAAQEEPDEIEPGFDPGSPFGPRGPELELELQLEFQRDADRQPPDEDDERDNAAYEADLAIGLVQPVGERLEVLADIELRAREYTGEREDDGDVTVRLERLYLERENEADTRRWRIGRQKLDDDMGWFVDEELDGFRYTLDRGITRLDVSFTRETWFEIGAEDRDDIIYNGLAVFRIDASDDSRWLPYLLHRSEREFRDEERAAETTWVGLQGNIRLNERFRYWLNASARSGEEERRDGGDRATGGVAVDLGATWTFVDRAFRPAVTLGFASASGDDDAGDGTDDTFRQSGLHSNEFALNDRNRFRYLGEVVDPELTNLEVITLGLGLRFDARWSADLAWHNYRQVEEEDELRGTDLDYEPEGGTDDLGRALDLVIGYERSRRLEFLAVAGRFEPGDAFADRPDAAWLFRLEMDYDLGL